MKSKRKIKKRHFIISVTLLALFYFGPSVLGGYSWTEYSAIRYTYPNQTGEVVYEKESGNKHVAIWDTGQQKYAKLVENPWGPLYRSADINEIGVKTADGKMKITWSASQKENHFYDTLFAAEIVDDDIVKVIVSNNGNDRVQTSLNEIKEQSTLYVEMDVVHGYAAHYSYLPSEDTGDFVFRGLNADGEIISISD